MNKESEHTKKQLIDNGFCLMYYKLSHRRRFIRTLYLIPAVFASIFLIQIVYENNLLTIGYSVFIILLGILQLTTNYKKWQLKKQDSDTSSTF